MPKKGYPTCIKKYYRISKKDKYKKEGGRMKAINMASSTATQIGRWLTATPRHEFLFVLLVLFLYS